MRTRAYRFSGNTPAFPAQWLYGLYVVSLVSTLCHHHQRDAAHHVDLTPALGRQDHTISPYTSAPFVIGTSASIASRPAFRDDREPPLGVGRDGEDYTPDLVKVKFISENTNIFSKNRKFKLRWLSPPSRGGCGRHCRKKYS